MARLTVRLRIEQLHSGSDACYARDEHVSLLTNNLIDALSIFAVAQEAGVREVPPPGSTTTDRSKLTANLLTAKQLAAEQTQPQTN